MILEQVRTLGLPTAKIQIQPASETLVNFETIFYTDEPSFDRSIDLLGYQVNIVASPVTYTWHTGDGSTLSTSGPGSPYPDKEIVHRYRDAHVTVHPRVDITYRVKFRVDGGSWRTVDQTLTASGNAVDLTIKEAVPVLTK